MRIIAGSAGGIRLQVPGAVARPTSDRVREALFAILGNLVPGAAVLDLFAGSGALAIESLSRGALRADLVEQDRKACRVIEANLAKARLADLAQVHCRDVGTFLKGAGERYDLVFADPPYRKRLGDSDHAAALLADAHLPQRISADGMLVLETAKGHVKTVPAPGWELVDHRSYGDTELSFFRPGAAAD